ncbi:T9SS type A sorting domain-containing protein [Chryseobacterium chendengshani]|uniref:T9SS type A sorting domain-containing protein n=1 Tax=Chryseobacterium sp. LJ756 TaxID=2864113 RepID=UPI001C643036|nr:T9SS type A sorting domain-containing protein [Chryseobacterium sp. LJ756]MBW7675859.1 T9SS type A sorting domain-containing protein [Chryseobacterium sp. LJ756]
MKHIVLFSCLLISSFGISQQKTTGDVPLSPNNGITANFTLDNATSKVTLVLKGPSDRWFGLGIGVNAGFSMSSGDAVVYSDVTTPKLTDRNFIGTTQPPLDSSQDWTIVSDVVSGTVRTLTLTRNLTNSDPNDYQMPYATTNSISFAGPRPATATTTVAPHGGTANVGYATASFTTVLGIDELSALEKNKVTVYPNPAKETVSFKNAEKIKSIDIYESTGRQVRSVKLEGENISVSDLRSGNYYLEITLKDGSLSYEKLIKE